MTQTIPAPTESSPPAPPWTPLDVAWALVYFVAWMGAVIAAGKASRAAGLPLDASAIIIVGTALLLVPVWYFSIYKYGATWADLGLRPFKAASVGLGCGLMLASLLFNIVYAAGLAVFNARMQPNIDLMFAGTQFPLLLLLGGALLAPIIEEIFFRGFVFSGLQQRWGWQKAAVISAGMFAAAHITPTAIIPIFILGLIFAYLYRVSNSIWPAIFMHMLTNTVALVAAYIVTQGWIPTP